jgi:hypothetical protein
LPAALARLGIRSKMSDGNEQVVVRAATRSGRLACAIATGQGDIAMRLCTFGRSRHRLPKVEDMS